MSSTFAPKLMLCLLFLISQLVCADDVRSSSLSKLEPLGFRVASSLPVGGVSERKLRPESEIKMRLEALRVLVMWVVAPADRDVSALKQQALEGHLKDWLTEDEKKIFRLEQAEAQRLHLNQIGWQMENMWSLAWVLGYETEPALKGEIEGDLARDLVLKFSGSEGVKTLRDLHEVIVLEDLFYCAHNAVRSAQQGAQSIPEGFEPIAEGRAIHERRHSLTWCLSPGVNWEDTDLSS